MNILPALVAAALAASTALSAIAQVDFNPEFEKEKSRVSFAPGIVVVRGKTQVIAPNVESVCPTGIVFKYNNGDLHVHDRRSGGDGGRDPARPLPPHRPDRSAGRPVHRRF